MVVVVVVVRALAYTTLDKLSSFFIFNTRIEACDDVLLLIDAVHVGVHSVSSRFLMECSMRLAFLSVMFSVYPLVVHPNINNNNPFNREDDLAVP